MRCAICDARLPQGQRIDVDICSICSHEIRLSLGMGDPLEELSNLFPARAEIDKDAEF